MKSSYIVTFIADDRPGLVEQVSDCVSNNQGNWLESRLTQLGGKFAGLALISLPAENVSALEEGLTALKPGNISISVTATGEQPVPASGSNIVLSVIGPDRPGIVREVSRILAQHQINVTELDSAVASAPMSAELIFSARIAAWTPESADIEGLRTTLDEIAEDMTLEIDLETA